MEKAEEHLKKAYGHFDRGEYKSALEECENSIEIDDSIADAHNLRGVLLEELDRVAEALGAYERALELEPGFKEAADNLSTLKDEFRKRDELVTAAVFNFLYEAEIAKMKLTAAGIWSFVAYGESANVMPHASIAMDGVKLKVKPEDAAKANGILKGF